MSISTPSRQATVIKKPHSSSPSRIRSASPQTATYFPFPITMSSFICHAANSLWGAPKHGTNKIFLPSLGNLSRKINALLFPLCSVKFTVRL